MAEFISFCSVVGMIVLYICVTAIPGLFVYRSFTPKVFSKPIDLSAAAISIFVGYVFGLIIFVCIMVYFVIM